MTRTWIFKTWLLIQFQILHLHRRLHWAIEEYIVYIEQSIRCNDIVVNISNAEFTNMQLYIANSVLNGDSMEAVTINRARFPNRHVPVHRTFESIHRRLRETGLYPITWPDAGLPRRVKRSRDRGRGITAFSE